MTQRKPIVQINGELHELPVGDTVSGVPGSSVWKEPVVALGGLSVSGTTIPNFLATVAGDVVMNDAA